MRPRMENRSARLHCTVRTCSWLILLVCPLLAIGSGGEGDKVELALYYETLCPYCSNFIVNLLVKVFDDGLTSVLDLKLVPYGNARIGVNDTITCQFNRATNPQAVSLSSMLSDMPCASYLAPSLLIYLCVFAVLSPSSSSKITLPSDSPNKVSLGLYYESLCPYSANFIVNHLPKIFDADLISHVDLNLAPWGNAKLEGNATFDCQHGPSECLLNTVEACAIDIWPELNEHFPLIYCIEKLVYSHEYTQWESCFEPLGLDSKLVSDCYAGGRGKELELKYAAETNALQPPHQYVPWVVVDGKPLYEDYENFLSYICEAYSGTAKPEACSELSLNRVQRNSHPVCYMKEKASSSVFEVMRSAVESMMSWTKMLLDV